MANPNRDTTAGAAFIDLRALARTQGRNVTELLDLYLLEGFLGRLATSPHSLHLVLKGGALLAAYGTRRPTRDVDLLATDLHVDTDTVLTLVQDIAGLPRDDGLEFDPASAAAHVIRDEDEYSGVRVSMTATLGRARLTFHVDVNVGDPVWPAPGPVTVPGLLGGYVELLGYPLPAVYAEKVITALQRGTANTRWRDFADVYLLRAAQQDVDGTDLTTALAKVAEYRGVTLRSLSETLTGYAQLGQTRYRAWVQRRDLTDRRDLRAWLVEHRCRGWDRRRRFETLRRGRARSRVAHLGQGCHGADRLLLTTPRAGLQAARWYSWMRPPRRSRRATLWPPTDGSPVSTGAASCRPRWGRTVL